MQAVVFREYDIRGIVGTQFNIEQVYDLGRAIAVLYTQLYPQTKTIAVGMDAREHSAAIKNELIRGLRDSGMNVIFLGVCPTPVLYFSQFTMPVDAGLMITASHNPTEYNGIKFCLNKMPIWGAQLTKLYNLMAENAHVDSAEQGTYAEVDGCAAYINYLVEQFNHLHASDVSVIFDCGNAVGGLIIPELIKRFEWRNARAMYAELDGTFPNHEPDPVVEANMVDLKKEILNANSMSEIDDSLPMRSNPSIHFADAKHSGRAVSLNFQNVESIKSNMTAYNTNDREAGPGVDPWWGVGFDGDCDRMAAMTSHGYLVPGDQMTAIFSKKILQDYPGATVVYDVRSSTLLDTMITDGGGHPYLSPCGHAIIKEAMHAQKAVLAGELSCHFFFADRYYGYDDGIYAALRLIELIINTQTDLAAHVAALPRMWNTPELRIHCPEENKRAVVEEVKKYFGKRTDATLNMIDGVRVQLPHGWGLVRASNTQAALSLRFEAKSSDALHEIQTEFATLLAPYLDASVLVQIGTSVVSAGTKMNSQQL